MSFAIRQEGVEVPPAHDVGATTLLSLSLSLGVWVSSRLSTTTLVASLWLGTQNRVTDDRAIQNHNSHQSSASRTHHIGTRTAT